MSKHFEVMTAPISSIGSETASFSDWLDGTLFAKVHSLTVCQSTRVQVETLDHVARDTRRRFPKVAQFFPEEGYLSDPMRITYARNCMLAGGHVLLIFGEDQVYCAAESISHDIKASYEQVNALVKIRRDQNEFKISVDTFDEASKPASSDDFINVYLCPWNNYGHWHVHNLSFIEALRRIIPNLLLARGASKVRLICSSIGDYYLRDLKEYTITRLRDVCALEVWGLAELGSSLWLDNVLVCSSALLLRGCRWPTAYKPLFQGLRVPRDSEAPRMIYCNRSHAGRRGVDNEEELQRRLVEIGFAILEPGKLSFLEQRRAFSNARLIVGSHGAALSNMIYSHVQPSIIELTHDRYGRPHYEWFQFLAAVMGFRHIAVMSELTEVQRQQDYNSTYFTVEIDSLLALLTPAVDVW